VRVAVELRNDSDMSKARVAMMSATGTCEVSEQELATLLKVDGILVSLSGSAFGGATAAGRGGTQDVAAASMATTAIVAIPFSEPSRL